MSWEMDYKKKLRTPEEALRCVHSGMRVYIQRDRLLKAKLKPLESIADSAQNLSFRTGLAHF